MYTVSQKRDTLLVTTTSGNIIFEILSLLDSAQNFLQNGHYISHHKLRMLLQYLMKPYCFKNRINSKI